MNYKNLLESLPQQVKLVAVSKTKPVEAIMELYNQGQRVFGENKVQELCEKEALLPKDIEWHQIGHLQTNKVKYMAGFVSMIHAVDSIKLLIEINKQAQKHKRIIDCLLQFHVAQEDTKFGLSLSEAKELITTLEKNPMHNICIRGVMGMASFVEDEEQIRSEFKTLKSYFDQLKRAHFTDESFDTISMGMSADYPLAIAEGSNLIRVGSLLFGSR